MFARVKRFHENCAGATSVEYSLLASLIAVVIIGICTSMFTALSNEYTEINVAFK